MSVQLPVDKYDSVASLEENLGSGVYKIRLLDRRAPVTIIAPHGGYIESGTSAIARSIAGREHNLFDFQGLKNPGAFDLHVTSTRFRHPQLTRLLDQARAAVSIHSMGKADVSTIWLGGLNRQLKELVLANLERKGFPVDPDSPYFRGENPENCVNLCAQHGVQLELSKELKDTLFRGPRFIGTRTRVAPQTTERFDDLVAAVRHAISHYMRTGVGS